MREPDELSVDLPDEGATRAAGRALAAALRSAGAGPAFITLAGELGSGKSTLVRGLLQAVGVGGPVRSPTFTLLESYAAGTLTIHHLDWYRLAAGDLDSLGFRDLLGPEQWVLVEWPERAPKAAERADLALALAYAEPGRRLTAKARSAAGRAVLQALQQAMA